MATGRVVEVYLDLLSQPCRAVHILLTRTKIPHRVHSVALRKGEHRTSEFSKLNPMQKVPVLVDGGFVLTESDAILKYLATTFDIPEHWYPWQPERRARVDEYTAWHHSNTRPHAAKVFILERRRAAKTKQQQSVLTSQITEFNLIQSNRQQSCRGTEICIFLIKIKTHKGKTNKHETKTKKAKIAAALPLSLDFFLTRNLKLKRCFPI
uniref:GST N-terminal domain-containing protein n=1 Tax=Xiphophorus couchianus TaxID=32473 RepID=A0A3B5LWF3_9TELE